METETEKMYNVVIPMAGKSSRFGHKFKPFLKLDNRTFIEHVMDSFSCIAERVNRYIFIVTAAQEKEFGVCHTLHRLFPDISNRQYVCAIPKTTTGPYQTVLGALSMDRMDNVIVCDCDHRVNVGAVIRRCEQDDCPDVVIPVWKIRDDEQQNWGKLVHHRAEDHVERFCEKEIIDRTGEDMVDREVYGMIGCYYFKTSRLLADAPHSYFSEMFTEKLGQYKFAIAPILFKDAYFFGTPKMVNETIEKRRQLASIFCDVDGVILKHSPHSTDDPEHNTLIEGTVKQLRKLRDGGHRIILSTARHPSTETAFRELLSAMDIPYDDVVMGLTPGPRYLINDVKPSAPHRLQAVAVNVTRDAGIPALCPSTGREELVRKFKGNSFSQTGLYRDAENHMFVRKHIRKTSGTHEHYLKLRRQCEDLRRFAWYSPGLVPLVLREEDNDYEYYVDLEYFPYEQLDTHNVVVQGEVLQSVIRRLHRDVYAYRRLNDGPRFMQDFMDSKIWPKLRAFGNECVIMDTLINHPSLKINGARYWGLYSLLSRIPLSKYDSKWINPIHGDLTLENILYNSHTEDFQLIDMEGSRYTDSCYFDLGKIYQSIVARYDQWNSVPLHVYLDNDGVQCETTDGSHLEFFAEHRNYDRELVLRVTTEYAKIMDENVDVTFRKGIFYMCTYFIRFVQFRRKVSKDHGLFAIVMAVNWLNALENDLQL